MGIELPDQGAVETAIDRWRVADPRLAALFERYDDAPRALRHYGLILWDEGDPQAAARILTGAVTLARADFRLWTDLAGALNAAGQIREAAACMEESLTLDARQTDGWVRLGTIRSALADEAGAEQALETALAIDPASTDARLSLGLLLFQGKRFGSAVEHLRAALRASVDLQANAAVQACYGQALSHCGAFAEAAAALGAATDLEPGNAVMVLKQAQAQFIADLIAGASVETAAMVCGSHPLLTASDRETIGRNGFHLLSAFGHTTAAIRLGEARLAAAPGDPERAYLLAVVRGEDLRRAPDAYVATFFDQFADAFDKQLVDVLRYSAHEHLAGLVDEIVVATRPELRRLLDLGCGTGLAAPLLARPGRHLTGVDLSSRMLEKARARGGYDDLVQAEAVSFCTGKPDAFDLVFAADVLIYVGDPEALVAAVAQSLVPGGLFAFTIETSDGADLALLPSGRFAHGLAPVLALAARVGLRMVTTKTIALRFETNGFVDGALIVLAKI